MDQEVGLEIKVEIKMEIKMEMEIQMEMETHLHLYYSGSHLSQPASSLEILPAQSFCTCTTLHQM